MSIVSDVKDWMSDGANWHGSAGIPSRLAAHLAFTGVSVAIAVVIAVPLALWLGHIGRGGVLAINVSNIGRAIPTYALLVLLFVAIGVTQNQRKVETVIALVAFALPPLITNTYVGIRDVDPRAKEAARGMGMSGNQMLWRVEVPLAMPLIMDGLRIAVVQVVATTTVAALIGANGLGRYVVDGFASQDPGQYASGAIIVGVLALLCEGIFSLLQRSVDPARKAGKKPRRRTVEPAVES